MSTRFQSSSTRAAWLILVCLLAGWVLMTGWRMAAADWLSAEPRYHIRAWQERGVAIKTTDWPRLHDQLTKAIGYTPKNPALHDFMAALYAYQGQLQWRDPFARVANFLQAKKHLEISLRLRPDNARSLASLAAARFALGEPTSQILTDLNAAERLAPQDPAIRRLAQALKNNLR